jgi:RNA polymerase sigma-70 factor, ECF subfamily
VDSPLSQPEASRLLTTVTVDGASAENAAAADQVIPDALCQELWRTSNSSELGLSLSRFGVALVAVGTKHAYGCAPGAVATSSERERFWRSLHVADLALAQACALGIDAAWEIFVKRYRKFLERTAIGITESSSLGKDLADSLYSELFGLTERDGQRRSPLASYSGRGSLSGWLRATLSQRYINHHRLTGRQGSLDSQDFPASVPDSEMSPRVAQLLSMAVTVTMRELRAEDRFLISAYFLDQRTLLQISYLLRVHEATVSRRLKRLTESLHKRLLKHLQACGMSKRAAEEALGTDPRDLDLNLRSILQDSRSAPFSNKEDSSNST